MVLLHGHGDTVADTVRAFEATAAADSEGILVAVPEASSTGSWDDGEDPVSVDDVGFLDALVEQILTRFPAVPPSKVFFYGFGMGSDMASRVACQSRTVRGVGFAGQFAPPPRVYYNCTPARPALPGVVMAGANGTAAAAGGTLEPRVLDFVQTVQGCTPMGRLEAVSVGGIASSAATCREYADCGPARLCVYGGVGHAVPPASTAAVWRFLAAAPGGEPAGAASPTRSAKAVALSPPAPPSPRSPPAQPPSRPRPHPPRQPPPRPLASPPPPPTSAPHGQAASPAIAVAVSLSVLLWLCLVGWLCRRRGRCGGGSAHKFQMHSRGRAASEALEAFSSKPDGEDSTAASEAPVWAMELNPAAQQAQEMQAVTQAAEAAEEKLRVAEARLQEARTQAANRRMMDMED